jgi:hypothetical protein
MRLLKKILRSLLSLRMTIKKFFRVIRSIIEKLRILPNSITFNFVTLSDSKESCNMDHQFSTLPRKSKDRGRLSEA